MVDACASSKRRPSIVMVSQVPSLKDALLWGLAYLGTMYRLVPNPCVVLDIDGTVLKNYDESSRRTLAKCQVPFRSFVNACNKAQIGIFIVTARPDFPDNRQWTENQLDQCDIRPLVATYMRPESMDTGEYKRLARDKIRDKGYTILLSIGDQFQDLAFTTRPDLDDNTFLVGNLGDDGSYAIKLPSE
jgi:predicted secreted acid phosphatase